MLYSFALLRVLFICVIGLMLVTGGRAAEVRSYFVGHIRPVDGWVRFTGLLVLILVVRLLTIRWWHLPGNDPRLIFGDCVIAPLNEEMVFRGLFLTILLREFSRRPWQAIGLSALVFASVHDLVRDHLFQFQFFLNLLLLGIALGTVFWKTRSVLGCVVAHMLWNACAFLPFVHRS